MIYIVINKLGKNIVISKKFLYSNILSLANFYCSEIRNTWMPTLKQEYFNNLWTTILVFAAITLVGLTIIQTACAILSLPKVTP